MLSNTRSTGLFPHNLSAKIALILKFLHFIEGISRQNLWYARLQSFHA
jgi:hypothetical protein